VALSAVPGRGGKDRIDELIGSYADVLGLKGWRVWDATQLATYLDGNEDVRRAFAGLITPGDVLSSLHDRLTTPLQANVHVTMPAARIRPGQPGQEPAFQAAYDAAGGASRLGEATTEVDQDGPGWVQHFDGGASRESAVLCALPDEPAVAVAGSVWHALCAIGRGAVGGGIVGVGFPAVDPTGQRPYLGSEAATVELAGGTWGRSGRGRLVRRGSDRWVWQPQVAFDREASRDRTAWTASSNRMDLRLRLAARIPLVADGLRITSAGRARMLAALARTGLADVVGQLAKRFGADAGDLVWRELDEPDGYNNSRFTAHHLSVAGVDGRRALWACLYFALPDSRATELLSVVDLRVDFDAISPTVTPDAPEHVPVELRLTIAELIAFFTHAWEVATMILPLAATEDPLAVPPAGAPRLELYVQNERPEMGSGDRTLPTVELVDLSAFGAARRRQLRDLAIAVTTPLGQTTQQIGQLVRQALVMIAEDFGFTAADQAKL
jgi:hypothetical protein